MKFSSLAVLAAVASLAPEAQAIKADQTEALAELESEAPEDGAAELALAETEAEVDEEATSGKDFSPNRKALYGKMNALRKKYCKGLDSWFCNKRMLTWCATGSWTLC